ncbi:MAG: response regulator [Candidatus Omnitrophota bacterium]
MAIVFTMTTLTGDMSQAFASIGVLNLAGEAKAQTQLRRDLYAMPAELGSLVSFWEPPAGTVSRGFMIHIQDAHANPEAQRNIAEILQFLAKKYSDLAIGVEGAAGPLHPEYLQFFREFPEAGRAVVEDLRQKGELGGAELYLLQEIQKRQQTPDRRPQIRNVEISAAVSSPNSDQLKRSGNWGNPGHPLPKENKSQDSLQSLVSGVEDAGLYRENLKTYRELLLSRDEIQVCLNPLRARLETEVSRGLNADLRDFLNERSRRKEGRYTPDRVSGDPDLRAYVNYLKRQVLKFLQIDLKDPIEQLRFPNLIRIVLTGEVQKGLDDAKVREDWKNVLALLKAAATDGADGEFVRAMSAFGREKGLLTEPQNGAPVPTTMEAALYPRKLLERLFLFAKKHSLAFAGHESFFKSLELIIFQAEVEAAGLLQEMNSLESLLTEKLAKTGAEKDLVHRLQNFQLLEKLLFLELTREEYEQVEVEQGSLGTFVEGAPALGNFLSSAKHFYVTVLRRDRALMENALALGAESKERQKVVVLITGGFHASGISAMLREQGISYATLTPHISRTDRGELYQKVMTGDHADLSAYFKVKNPFSTKQEALFFKALVETAAPVLFEKYQLESSRIATAVTQSVNTHPVLSGAVAVSSSTGDKRTALRFIPKAVMPQNMAVAAPANTAEVSFLRSLTEEKRAEIRFAATVDFETAKTLTLSIKPGVIAASTFSTDYAATRSEAREKISSGLAAAGVEKLRGKNQAEVAAIIGATRSGISQHLDRYPKAYQTYQIRKPASRPTRSSGSTMPSKLPEPSALRSAGAASFFGFDIDMLADRRISAKRPSLDFYDQETHPWRSDGLEEAWTRFHDGEEEWGDEEFGDETDQGGYGTGGVIALDGHMEHYGIFRHTDIAAGLAAAGVEKLRGKNQTEVAAIISSTSGGVSQYLARHPEAYETYGILRPVEKVDIVAGLAAAGVEKLRGKNQTEVAAIIGATPGGVSHYLDLHPEAYETYAILRPVDIGAGLAAAGVEKLRGKNQTEVAAIIGSTSGGVSQYLARHPEAYGIYQIRKPRSGSARSEARENVGDHLKAMREHLGTTREAFGAALDPGKPVPEVTLATWENGTSPVPGDVMKKAEGIVKQFLSRSKTRLRQDLSGQVRSDSLNRSETREGAALEGLNNAEIVRRITRLLLDREVEAIATDKDRVKYVSLKNAVKVIQEFGETRSDLKEDIELLISLLNLPAEKAANKLFGIDMTLEKLFTNFHSKKWTTDFRMQRVRLAMSQMRTEPGAGNRSEMRTASEGAGLARRVKGDSDAGPALHLPAIGDAPSLQSSRRGFPEVEGQERDRRDEGRRGSSKIRGSNREPDAEEASSDYRRSEVRGTLADILKEKFPAGASLAFLDLDTGTGNFIEAFKAFLERMGYQVNRAIGTEPLQGIIKQASSSIRGRIVHANAQFPEEFLLLGKNTFDIATVNHIETAPGELARRARELLKPSGLLLVTVEESDVADGVDARIIREIREAGFDVQSLRKPADYPPYDTPFRSPVLLVSVPRSARSESRGDEGLLQSVLQPPLSGSSEGWFLTVWPDGDDMVKEIKGVLGDVLPVSEEEQQEITRHLVAAHQRMHDDGFPVLTVRLESPTRIRQKKAKGFMLSELIERFGTGSPQVNRAYRSYREWYTAAKERYRTLFFFDAKESNATYDEQGELKEWFDPVIPVSDRVYLQIRKMRESGQPVDSDVVAWVQAHDEGHQLGVWYRASARTIWIESPDSSVTYYKITFPDSMPQEEISGYRERLLKALQIVSKPYDSEGWGYDKEEITRIANVALSEAVSRGAVVNQRLLFGGLKSAVITEDRDKEQQLLEVRSEMRLPPYEEGAKKYYELNKAFFDEAPIIEDLTSFLDWYQANRPKLISRKDPEEFLSASYASQVLFMAGKITAENFHEIHRKTGAYEYAEQSAVIQSAPTFEEFGPFLDWYKAYRAQLPFREKPEERISAGYTVQVLVQAGKISAEKEKSFYYQAAAYEYAEQSAVIQGAPQFEEFSAFMDWYKANRAQLLSRDDPKESISAGYTAQALVQAGKIPAKRSQEFHRAALAYEYAEQSAVVQKAPQFEVFSAFWNWFKANRKKLVSREDPEEKISAGYTVHVLAQAGKIATEKLMDFRFEAAAYEYAEQSAVIQKAPQFETFSDFLDWYKENRVQLVSREDPAEVLGAAYTVQALVHAGKISLKRSQEFERTAVAYEYAEQSEVIQRAPIFEVFNDFWDWYKAHATELVSRQNAQKVLAAGTATTVLAYAGKIPLSKLQDFRRNASAREYAEQSSVIQNAPGFKSLEAFWQWYKAHRPELISRENPEEVLGAPTTVSALFHAKKIPEEKFRYFQQGSAAMEYAEQSAVIQGAPSFEDFDTLLDWYKEHRADLVSRDNPEEGISAAYVVQILTLVGKVPPKREKEFRFNAGAFEYGEQSAVVQNAPVFSNFEEFLDWYKTHSVELVSGEDPGKVLGGTYTVLVLHFAGKIPGETLFRFQYAASAYHRATLDRDVISAEMKRIWTDAVPPAKRLSELKRRFDETKLLNLKALAVSVRKPLSKQYRDQILTRAYQEYGEEVMKAPARQWGATLVVLTKIPDQFVLKAKVHFMLPPFLFDRLHLELGDSQKPITKQSRVEIVLSNKPARRMKIDIDETRQRFILTYAPADGSGPIVSEIPMLDTSGKLTTKHPLHFYSAFRAFYDDAFGIPLHPGIERKHAIKAHLLAFSKKNLALERQLPFTQADGYIQFWGRLYLPGFYYKRPEAFRIVTDRESYPRFLMFWEKTNPGNYVVYEYYENYLESSGTGERISFERYDAETGKKKRKGYSLRLYDISEEFRTFDAQVAGKIEPKDASRRYSNSLGFQMGETSFSFLPSGSVQVHSYSGVRKSDSELIRPVLNAIPVTLEETEKQQKIVAHYDNPSRPNAVIIDGITNEASEPVRFQLDRFYNLAVILKLADTGELPGIKFSDPARSILAPYPTLDPAVDKKKRPPVRNYQYDTVKNEIAPTEDFRDPVTFEILSRSEVRIEERILDVTTMTLGALKNLRSLTESGPLNEVPVSMGLLTKSFEIPITLRASGEMGRRGFLRAAGTIGIFGAALWALGGATTLVGQVRRPAVPAKSVPVDAASKAMNVMNQVRYAVSLEPLQFNDWNGTKGNALATVLGELNNFSEQWKKIPKQGVSPEKLGEIHRAFFQNLARRINSGTKLSEDYGLDYVRAIARLMHKDLPQFFAAQGMVFNVKGTAVENLTMQVTRDGQVVRLQDYFYPTFVMPAKYFLVLKANARRDLKMPPQVLGDEKTPLILVQPVRIRISGGQVQFSPYAEPWKESQNNELGFADGATAFLRADLIEQALKYDRVSLGKIDLGFFAEDLSLRNAMEGVRVDEPEVSQGKTVKIIFYPITDLGSAAGYAGMKLMVAAMRSLDKGKTVFDFGFWQLARYLETAKHETTHVNDSHRDIWRTIWQMCQPASDQRVSQEEIDKAQILREQNARLETLRKVPEVFLKSLLNTVQVADRPVSSGDKAQADILTAILKELNRDPVRYGIDVVETGLKVDMLQKLKPGEKVSSRMAVTLDKNTQIMAQFYRITEKPDRIEALYTAVRKALNLDARAQALAAKYNFLDPARSENRTNAQLLSPKAEELLRSEVRHREPSGEVFSLLERLKIDRSVSALATDDRMALSVGEWKPSYRALDAKEYNIDRGTVKTYPVYLRIGPLVILSKDVDAKENEKIFQGLRRMPGLIVLRMNARLYFNKYTKAVLGAMLVHDFRDELVEDIGTGPGVLALASLEMGARRVAGIDKDPAKLLEAKAELERYGYEGKLLLKKDGDWRAYRAGKKDRFILIEEDLSKYLKTASTVRRSVLGGRPDIRLANFGFWYNGAHEELLKDTYNDKELPVAVLGGYYGPYDRKGNEEMRDSEWVADQFRVRGWGHVWSRLDARDLGGYREGLPGAEALYLFHNGKVSANVTRVQEGLAPPRVSVAAEPVRSEIREVAQALENLKTIRVREIENGNFLEVIEQRIVEGRGRLGSDANMPSYFLKDYVARMERGEKILEPSEIPPPVETEFGLIDLSRLNDVTRYKGYDAGAQLARDLHIAHLLGLISLSQFKGVSPSTHIATLLKKKKIEGIKDVNINWAVWSLLKSRFAQMLEEGKKGTYRGDGGQVRFYKEVFGPRAPKMHAGQLFNAISSMIPGDLNWKKMDMNLEAVSKLREDFEAKLKEPGWIEGRQGDAKQLEYYLEAFGPRVRKMRARNLYSAISSILDQRLGAKSLRQILDWHGVSHPMSELVEAKGDGSLVIRTEKLRSEIRENQQPLARPVKNILVVDGEKTQASAMGGSLENIGFKVVVEHSGEEALERLKQFKPDVIVTDVLKPAGYAWVEEAVERKELGQIPIFFLLSGDAPNREAFERAKNRLAQQHPVHILEKSLEGAVFKALSAELRALDPKGSETGADQATESEFFRAAGLDMKTGVARITDLWKEILPADRTLRSFSRTFDHPYEEEVVENGQTRKVSKTVRVTWEPFIPRSAEEVKRVMDIERQSWQTMVGLDVPEAVILERIFGKANGERRPNPVIVVRVNDRIEGGVHMSFSEAGDALQKLPRTYAAMQKTFVPPGEGKDLAVVDFSVFTARETKQYQLLPVLVDATAALARLVGIKKVIAYSRAELFDHFVRKNPKFQKPEYLGGNGKLDTEKVFDAFVKTVSVPSGAIPFKEYAAFFRVDTSKMAPGEAEEFFKTMQRQIHEKNGANGPKPKLEEVRRYFTIEEFRDIKEFAVFHITRIGDPFLSATHQKLGAQFGGFIQNSRPEDLRGGQGNVSMVYDLSKSRAEVREDRQPLARPIKNILVVDDEESIAEIVSEVLVDAGYSVAVAHSGDEALEKLGPFMPDAIISDILMPGMKGYEWVTEAVKKPGLEKIPVVFISGNVGNQEAFDQSVDALKQQHPVHFLAKPFSIFTITPLFEDPVTNFESWPGRSEARSSLRTKSGNKVATVRAEVRAKPAAIEASAAVEAAGVRAGGVTAAFSKIQSSFSESHDSARDSEAVFIWGNDPVPHEVIRQLQREPRKGAQHIHIGFSGLENLNFVVARDSGGFLWMNRNGNMRRVFEETRKIIIAEKADRFDFVKRMKEIFSYEPPYWDSRGFSQRMDEELMRPGSWLSSDGNFEKVQRLFRESKVLFIEADASNASFMKSLQEIFNAEGIRVDTLFLTNIPDWIKNEGREAAFFEAMSVLGDSNTLVIQSNLTQLWQERRQEALESFRRWAEISSAGAGKNPRSEVRAEEETRALEALQRKLLEQHRKLLGEINALDLLNIRTSAWKPDRVLYDQFTSLFKVLGNLKQGARTRQYIRLERIHSAKAIADRIFEVLSSPQQRKYRGVATDLRALKRLRNLLNIWTKEAVALQEMYDIWEAGSYRYDPFHGNNDNLAIRDYIQRTSEVWTLAVRRLLDPEGIPEGFTNMRGIVETFPGLIAAWSREPWNIPTERERRPEYIEGYLNGWHKTERLESGELVDRIQPGSRDAIGPRHRRELYHLEEGLAMMIRAAKGLKLQQQELPFGEAGSQRSELRGSTTAARDLLAASNNVFVLGVPELPQDAIIDAAHKLDAVFSVPGIVSYLPEQVSVHVDGRPVMLPRIEAARGWVVGQMTKQVLMQAAASGISNERLAEVLEMLQKALPDGVMLPSGTSLEGPQVHVHLTDLTENDRSALITHFAVVLGVLVSLRGRLLINMDADNKTAQDIGEKIRALAKQEGITLAPDQLKIVPSRQEDPFLLKGVQKVDALVARSGESFDKVPHQQGVGSRWVTEDAGDMKTLAAALTTVLYATLDKQWEANRFNIHKPSEYDHGALLATILQAIQGYLQIRTAA